MNRNINKKGMTINILVGIIIVLLTFIVYLSFFSSIISPLNNKIEDVQCRVLLSFKDMTKVPGLGVWFKEINKKCKVEDLSIDNKDKDTTLKPIAEMMQRCWYRYGEGKLDFLSNYDTEGEWCFKCANLEFENKENDVLYEYTDLVDWMKNNEIKISNDSISYYDYVNIVEINGLPIINNNPSFEGVIPDDEETIDFYLDMEMTNAEFINSYKFKQINPKDEKLYVVYRFIRVEENLVDDLIDFISAFGTETGIYGGYKFSKYAFKSTVGAATSPIDAVKKIKDSLVYEKPKGTLIEGEKINYRTIKGNVGKYEISNINSDGTYQLKSIYNKNPTKFTLGSKKSRELEKRVGIFKKFSKKSVSILEKNKLAAIVIGTTSTLYSLVNKNYVQYVDIMNEEQYYRMCGTERFEDKN